VEQSTEGSYQELFHVEHFGNQRLSPTPHQEQIHNPKAREADTGQSRLKCRQDDILFFFVPNKR
jgi:hypothetical protein